MQVNTLLLILKTNWQWQLIPFLDNSFVVQQFLSLHMWKIECVIGMPWKLGVTRSVTLHQNSDPCFPLTQVHSKTVKWQNTTWSWSRELELTEGTWLQLMCCTPSQLCCPQFQSNRVHDGILEYTGEEGEDGETRGLHKWVHYGRYTN